MKTFCRVFTRHTCKYKPEIAYTESGALMETGAQWKTISDQIKKTTKQEQQNSHLSSIFIWLSPQTA